MAWCIDNFITAKEIQSSLVKMSLRAFSILSLILNHPQMVRWLTAALKKSKVFVVPFNFVEQYYSAILMNEIPTSITCHHGLVPWMDVHFLFVVLCP